MLIEQKQFIAHSIEGWNMFSAWEIDGKFYVYEYLPYNQPSVNVIMYESLDKMVESIEWEDWILNGKLDQELRDAINAYDESQNNNEELNHENSSSGYNDAHIVSSDDNKEDKGVEHNKNKHTFGIRELLLVGNKCENVYIEYNVTDRYVDCQSFSFKPINGRYVLTDNDEIRYYGKTVYFINGIPVVFEPIHWFIENKNGPELDIDELEERIIEGVAKIHILSESDYRNKISSLKWRAYAH